MTTLRVAGDHVVVAPEGGQARILLSGGLDSAACLAAYLERDFIIDALFVDYGQAASKQERKAARALCDHYSVELATVRCELGRQFGEGYVPGRNALLLQLAYSSLGFDVGQIVIGLQKGPPYVDCSPVFVDEMQRVFDLYSDGRISISAPFVDVPKAGIVRYCREHAVPMALTYSCETGHPSPCRECATCRDLIANNVL